MLDPDPHPLGPDRIRSYADFLDQQSHDRPKGERTSARIRIAACNLLHRLSPQEVTIPALCKEAGIAHGTFYLYFPDRTRLMADTLLGFVTFLQDAMRQASALEPQDRIRAATTAYAELFERNAGLMNCLLHHHDTFPEARAAFGKLNREWIETVVASVQKRLRLSDRAGDITHEELLRRGHALGGMVDQYLSGLILSADPALIALSTRRSAVIDTLCRIWERGMEP